MEKIKVSTFEGVDVTQGLIFIDEDTYDIRNIITVDHVIIEPRRSIYRVCIFGGLGLMFGIVGISNGTRIDTSYK